MEMTVIGKYRTLLVKLTGEIDHHSVKKIRSAVDREFEKTGVINIAFDFSGVEFMDSSGIGMIIGRYKKAGAVGGRIIVSCANEGIREIISMSGLEGSVIVSGNLQSGLEEAVK